MKRGIFTLLGLFAILVVAYFTASKWAIRGLTRTVAQEVGPHNVTINCINPGIVDGERMQDGNTSTMIFGVAKIVSYLSEFMTLYPGDVITTGTPPGVGMGVKPNPIFLKPGDVMKLGIDKLGEQQQTVHAWDAKLLDD